MDIENRIEDADDFQIREAVKKALQEWKAKNIKKIDTQENEEYSLELLVTKDNDSYYDNDDDDDSKRLIKIAISHYKCKLKRKTLVSWFKWSNNKLDRKISFIQADKYHEHFLLVFYWNKLKNQFRENNKLLGQDYSVNVSQAVDFYRFTLKKKAFLFWFSKFNKKQKDKQKINLKILAWKYQNNFNNKIISNFWKKWRLAWQTHYSEIIVGLVLWKHLLLKRTFHALKCFVSIKKEAALKAENKLIKIQNDLIRYCFKNWHQETLISNERRKLCKAEDFYCSSLCRKVIISWHFYTQKEKSKSHDVALKYSLLKAIINRNSSMIYFQRWRNKFLIKQLAKKYCNIWRMNIHKRNILKQNQLIIYKYWNIWKEYANKMIHLKIKELNYQQFYENILIKNYMHFWIIRLNDKMIEKQYNLQALIFWAKNSLKKSFKRWLSYTNDSKSNTNHGQTSYLIGEKENLNSNINSSIDNLKIESNILVNFNEQNEIILKENKNVKNFVPNNKNYPNNLKISNEEYNNNLYNDIKETFKNNHSDTISNNLENNALQIENVTSEKFYLTKEIDLKCLKIFQIAHHNIIINDKNNSEKNDIFYHHSDSLCSFPSIIKAESEKPKMIGTEISSSKHLNNFSNKFINDFTKINDNKIKLHTVHPRPPPKLPTFLFKDNPQLETCQNSRLLDNIIIYSKGDLLLDKFNKVPNYRFNNSEFDLLNSNRQSVNRNNFTPNYSNQTNLITAVIENLRNENVESTSEELSRHLFVVKENSSNDENALNTNNTLHKIEKNSMTVRNNIVLLPPSAFTISKFKQNEESVKKPLKKSVSFYDVGSNHLVTNIDMDKIRKTESPIKNSFSYKNESYDNKNNDKVKTISDYDKTMNQNNLFNSNYNICSEKNSDYIMNNNYNEIPNYNINKNNNDNTENYNNYLNNVDTANYIVNNNIKNDNNKSTELDCHFNQINGAKNNKNDTEIISIDDILSNSNLNTSLNESNELIKIVTNESDYISSDKTPTSINSSVNSTASNIDEEQNEIKNELLLIREKLLIFRQNKNKLSYYVQAKKNLEKCLEECKKVEENLKYASSSQSVLFNSENKSSLSDDVELRLNKLLHKISEIEMMVLQEKNETSCLSKRADDLINRLIS